MHDYLHKVQYYETDQMRVVHHSNYIRWFEEARIDYLDAVGVRYCELEERGIISPVVAVSCQYHAMTRFGETVRISVRLNQVQNVRYRLSYALLDAQSGQLRATGESTHCFVDPLGHVLSLKRADPVLFERFRQAAQEPV